MVAYQSGSSLLKIESAIPPFSVCDLLRCSPFLAGDLELDLDFGLPSIANMEGLSLAASVSNSIAYQVRMRVRLLNIEKKLSALSLP